MPGQTEPARCIGVGLRLFGLEDKGRVGGVDIGDRMAGGQLVDIVGAIVVATGKAVPVAIAAAVSAIWSFQILLIED